jgi:hypothetical protein
MENIADVKNTVEQEADGQTSFKIYASQKGLEGSSCDAV